MRWSAEGARRGAWAPTPARVAGAGALLVAACYLTGVIFLLGPLAKLGLGAAGADPAPVLAFVRAAPWVLPLWMTVIYDASALGAALAGLGLAGMTARAAPALGLAAVATALVWAGLTLASGMIARAGLAELARLAPVDPALAAETWRLTHLIETALSGRTEVVGGAWIGLASFAAFRIGALSGVAALLGGLVAGAGLATFAPGLSDVFGFVFGVGAIMWFGWAGLEWLARPT